MSTVWEFTCLIAGSIALVLFPCVVFSLVTRCSKIGAKKVRKSS